MPNVLITSAFRSKGVWNAAHCRTRRFDTAANNFLAAIALKDQRRYETQMQTILLRETPVIIPYFYDSLGGGLEAGPGLPGRRPVHDLPQPHLFA